MRYDASEWRSETPPWVEQAIAKVRREDSPHWWKHSPDCADTVDTYTLSGAQANTLVQWIEDGQWEGDEADFAPSPSIWTPPPRSPNISVDVAAFAPPQDAERTMRCFVLPAEFSEQTYLTALGIRPDRIDQIAHVSVAAIPPEEALLLVRQDNDNQEPGFDCFGQFSEAKQARYLYAWTPGMPEGLAYPDGHAYVLRPGARLAMQIQYAPSRSASSEEGEALGPDETALDLWTLPSGETPSHEIRVLPFAQVRIEIEPGETNKIFASEHVAPYPLTVLGMTPHMLDFAKSFKLESYPVEDNASPNPRCMAHLPQWDFASSKYTLLLAPDERIALQRGDRFRQSCVYDNSPENQPERSDGLENEPRKLVWGADEENEMCINHIITAIPFEEDRHVDCSIVPECLESCQPNDIECFALCAIRSSVDCTECSFAKLINCAGYKCDDRGVELARCINICDLTSGYGLNCIQNNCAFEWQEFSNCGIEKMTDGTCVLDDCL